MFNDTPTIDIVLLITHWPSSILFNDVLYTSGDPEIVVIRIGDSKCTTYSLYYFRDWSMNVELAEKDRQEV